MTSQVALISLEELIESKHPYRYLKEVLLLNEVMQVLGSVDKSLGRLGDDVESLFYCLLLQFMEDLNGRELERYLRENTAAKWFCGFSLRAVTPDHTVYVRLVSE